MTVDISTEDLELFHYGVKGMKWGVRKDGKSSGRKARYSELRNKELATLELTAKNGKQVRVTQDRNSKFVDFVSSLSKKGTESAYDRSSFTFEADGKKVGEASFDKVSSDELNLVWLGINKNERGQGYASAVFDAAVQYGKSEGVDRLTLEVPGNAPDARHIYAKQGFTVTKEPTSKEIKNDPIWGGLTHMELDLTKERIRHSALTDDELLEKALDETFTPLPPDVEADIFGDSEIEHSAEDLELFHYGVKGMKWGVRKSDRESRRESSAKKFESKAAEYRSQSKGLESTNTRSARRKQSRLEKKEAQALRDAEAKRQGKLTRNQKLVVAGAAVVATYAAYKIGRNTIESGELNRQIMKGKAFLEKTEPSFNKKSAYSSKKWDADQLNLFVASGINDLETVGGRNNCRRCTLTYEMRRRGFDVKATKTTNGYGQATDGLYNVTSKRGEKFVKPGVTGILSRMIKEEYSISTGASETKPFMDFLDDVKPAGGRGRNKIDLDSDPVKRSKNIFDALSKEPDGARGELGIAWTAGSGHSVAWEVVKGKPVIFDTQTGQHFKDSDSFTKYASRVRDSGYTRLDNVELNQDFLMRWMKNA